MNECRAVVMVGDHHAQKRALLICWLPPGHEGLHYDEGDNITWKEGKPDD